MPTENDDLPVLKPVKAIAKCGFCGNEIYPDGQCQAEAKGFGGQPAQCPLRGEEWRRWKMAMDMRPAFPIE